MSAASEIPQKTLEIWPNVCRLCLSNNGNDNAPVELYPIEDIYVERNNLTESITSFRDILTIFTNDDMETNEGELPSVVCLACAKRAQEAYSFIEQCRRSDKLLEAHFERLKTENDPETNQLQVEISDVQNDSITNYPRSADPTDSELQDNESKGTMIEQSHKKRFYCDKCDKSFSQTQTLRRHYRSHDKTGSNLKACTFCGKQFLRSDDLARHVRTHTGERPYKCKICPKAYKQWSELNEHCLTHTATKPYNCTECCKQFSSRNGLYIHAKTHKGDKLFSGLSCSNSFTTCE